MEKKLHRSRDKKVIAGIAGGLGEYLDIDPIIIRIIIVLITVFHGIGLLIYIVMWIIVPEAPYVNKSFAEEKVGDTGNLGQTIEEEVNKAANEANNVINDIKKHPTSSNGRIIFGLILISFGAIFLFEKLFPFVDFEFIFAIGLIVLGLAMLFNFFNKSETSS